MSRPDLDRMAVDDVATSPERIAAEIHRQLGEIPAPVPIHAIALALGIFEIRERPLNGFEGALVTDAERSDGSILVNSSNGPYRLRYSVAHELADFLCAWHEQTGAGGFQCTRQDMILTGADTRHVKQEAEANRFAIELLAPHRLIARHLKRLPDLEHVVSMAAELEISKAAAARRYVSLHRETLAVVFARDGHLLYAQRGSHFPWLAIKKKRAIRSHLCLTQRKTACPICVKPAAKTGASSASALTSASRFWLRPTATPPCSCIWKTSRMKSNQAAASQS